MMNEQFENYVLDLGVLVKEKALEAKTTKDKSSCEKDDDYHLGYLMAFYEIVSLMQQQAAVFDIDLAQLGLEDIDPESELLQ